MRQRKTTAGARNGVLPIFGLGIAAWYDVRTRPLRTLAAVAGMVAAVGALMVVDAAGVLSRNGADDYLRRQYGQPATFLISATGSSDARQQTEADTLLTQDLGKAGFRTISPYRLVRGITLDGDRSAAVDTAVVDDSYPDVRVIDLVSGEFPTRAADRGVPRAVLDEEIVRQLGWEPHQIVGQPLQYAATETAAAIDTRNLRTVTVVVDAVMASTARDDTVPRLLLVGRLPPQPRPEAEETPGGWLARVAPADTAYFQEVVASTGRRPGSESGFQATRLDQDEALAPVIDQQTRTAGIVAWVAMAVGGLGMLGVGVASVRERARELGVRRALGASRITIFLGVLVETMFNVLVAAALAVPLAALLVHLLPQHLVVAEVPTPPDAVLPVSSALRGLAAAAAVGLLAGLMPAARAVRASVISAIRG